MEPGGQVKLPGLVFDSAAVVIITLFLTDFQTCYLSVTLDHQGPSVLVSGVRHSSYTVLYFTK